MCECVMWVAFMLCVCVSVFDLCVLQLCFVPQRIADMKAKVMQFAQLHYYQADIFKWAVSSLMELFDS